MESRKSPGIPRHRCTSITTSTRRSTSRQGELDIVCGAERYRAGAGAFAFLPSGIAHTFRAVSEARLLTIAVPGGVEGFFRGAGRPASNT